MRVVFVTHNELGLACMEELVDLDAEIAGVFTRPRRPEIADQTDLAGFAASEGIPLHEVESLNHPEARETIEGYEPDLLFVIGWSQLVSQGVLDSPSVAALGMHPAPLPRGRGRAPIAWSLIKGLDETALSFFHLVREADAGDLVGQESIEIEIGDDAASLYGKVVEAGRELIRRYYPEFEAGRVPRTPQDEGEATWWPKRTPDHGLIDWNRPPGELYDWVRGQTHPYPGAFSVLDGRRVTVWAARPPAEKRAFGVPGTIGYREGNVLGICAWEGVLEVTRVQVGDDEEIPAGALLDRYEISIGDRFENARDLLVADGG